MNFPRFFFYILILICSILMNFQIFQFFNLYEFYNLDEFSQIWPLFPRFQFQFHFFSIFFTTFDFFFVDFSSLTIFTIFFFSIFQFNNIFATFILTIEFEFSCQKISRIFFQFSRQNYSSFLFFRTVKNE